MNKERQSQARLEDAIVNVLKGSEPGISILDLMERVENCGSGAESAIKGAIARMLAESKIEMTSQRRIHLPSTANRVRNDPSASSAHLHRA
jgi:hypothetical protein